MIQTDSDVRDGQATRGNKRILLLVLGLGIALTAAGVFFYAQPRAIEFHEQHYDPDDRKIDRPMDGDSIEITEFRGPKKARRYNGVARTLCIAGKTYAALRGSAYPWLYRRQNDV
jgi:hypothetical protein